MMTNLTGLAVVDARTIGMPGLGAALDVPLALVLAAVVAGVLWLVVQVARDARPAAPNASSPLGTEHRPRPLRVAA